jgi:hypothetical protein
VRVRLCSMHESSFVLDARQCRALSGLPSPTKPRQAGVWLGG